MASIGRCSTSVCSVRLPYKFDFFVASLDDLRASWKSLSAFAAVAFISAAFAAAASLR
eukprot:SAG11_NODE_35063_length_268_cov_1.213018_1_plen_57_part_01